MLDASAPASIMRRDNANPRDINPLPPTSEVLATIRSGLRGHIER
jgi:hypothetical protein